MTAGAPFHKATTAEGPPDYGTARWAELPHPIGLVLGVFCPHPNGTTRMALFGPSWPGDDDPHAVAARLLEQARDYAAQHAGTVVRLPVLADYSGGVMVP